MEITIEQQPFSFTSHYEIRMPDSIFTAHKLFLSNSAGIRVLGPRRRLLARIRGHLNPFRAAYRFIFADGERYRFRREKFWKAVYLCSGENESFQLYGHKGLNFSIFQEDRQIAAFCKNQIKISTADYYEVRMNDDANRLAVICMILALDCEEFGNEGEFLSYDFGNFVEERPFDSRWQPS